MSTARDFTPTSQADTRPMNRVLAVIPIGVAVLTVVFTAVDLATGALHL